MNLEIGTEAPIFLFWEYLLQNLGIFSLQCMLLMFTFKKPIITKSNPINIGGHRVLYHYQMKTAKFSYVYLIDSNNSLDSCVIVPAHKVTEFLVFISSGLLVP